MLDPRYKFHSVEIDSGPHPCDWDGCHEVAGDTACFVLDGDENSDVQFRHYCDGHMVKAISTHGGEDFLIEPTPEEISEALSSAFPDYEVILRVKHPQSDAT